jgi:hypothetical protein
MVQARYGVRLFAVATLGGAASCSFDVGAIPVHRDTQASDAGETSRDDAGSVDAGSLADAASPSEAFRDDFERPDGRLDGPWRDKGPGTPELWKGELCLQAEEQAQTRLSSGPYGHVELRVFARKGFELHVEGEDGDLLTLIWDDGGSIRDPQGVEVAAGDERSPFRGSLHHLRFALDYQAQAATIQVDGGVEVTLPFVSVGASALRALRMVNGWTSEDPPFQSMCVDNVYIAAERPTAAPFAEVERPVVKCESEHEPIHECAAQRCCGELAANGSSRRFTATDDSAQRCIEEGASGTLAFCEDAQRPSSETARKLAECIDTFCARSSSAGSP